MSITPSELYGAGHATINIFPDDVLLIVFEFYRADSMNYLGPTYTWHRLVHVCQRWRHVVFASPSRLGLHIVCTETTPVRELLDIWPPLPIVIRYWLYSTSNSTFPILNAITTLEHHDRICQIQLSHLTRPLLDMLATAMQEPYPALTTLELWSDDETAIILPDTFLGGFAPRLQRVWLEGLVFPALPKLLLSAVDLVSLLLDKIPPNTGYISPEVMATSLSLLTKLKYLRIDFRSPGLPPDIRQHVRQQTHALLPLLTCLEFRGVREYMEDLLARVEAPLLESVNIKFFNELTFDVPQLLRFISYAKKVNSPNGAKVDFHSDFVQITLSPRSGTVGHFTLQVLCAAPLWQVSSMVQICSQAIPLLSGVERLDICGGEDRHLFQEWRNEIVNIQWLGLFHSFIAVESLHVTEYLGPFIASALREGTRRKAAEVLPALRSLFLEGLDPSELVKGSIGGFIAARGRSGRHVTIYSQKSEWDHNLG